MRIGIIVLSVITGLVMIQTTVIPMRLSVLISSEQRPHDAVGSILLFCVWTAATALVYAFPVLSVWLFAIAGCVGLYDGITYGIEEFTLWGAVALAMAVLSTLARREKRIAEQIELAEEQHRLAVYLALKSLHEAVPELLSRTAQSEQREPNMIDPQARRQVSRVTTTGPGRHVA